MCSNRGGVGGVELCQMFTVFIRRASILGFSATGEEDGGEKIRFTR